MTRLLSCLIVLSPVALFAIAGNQEVVTLDAIAKDPQAYMGKTVFVRKVALYGAITPAANRYRFAVKTPSGLVLKTQFAENQSVIVASKDKGETIKRFVDTLSPEYYYTVNLTCEIMPSPYKNDKGKDRYFVIVREIEQVGLKYKDQPKQEPAPEAKPEPKSKPAVKDVTLSALNGNPEKFDGQTLTVSGQVSGTVHEGNGARFRLTFKDAKTTINGEKPATNGINFFILRNQKELLMDGLQSARFYPVRLTVSVSQEANGRWVAVVSEIDRNDR